MNIMDVASSLGLVDPTGTVVGTIDQQKVLGTLVELAEKDPAHTDLYAETAGHVRSARSAGMETHDAKSFQARPGAEATTQLRYRSEMADLFMDLAIDVGLRLQDQKLMATA
ncbi:MAG: hypothetical protein ABJH68_20935 [Ilumatobacter sp.]|uniref:hypothetical protein n=2 Tax=Ilumatobacter sp. TaxID=1967498 RepID=UPI00329A3C4F